MRRFTRWFATASPSRASGVVTYAGVPRRTSEGETLGALCAIDIGPVRWIAAQIALTDHLSAVAMAEIELRGTECHLSQAQSQSQSQSRNAALADRDTLAGFPTRHAFAVRCRKRHVVVKQTGTPSTSSRCRSMIFAQSMWSADTMPGITH